MQVYKVIPSNPNVIMVRNTLAIYGGLNVETRSVGDLVALAKVGGTTVPGRTPAVKSAFAISEVGGTTGKLITGAEPFWNIYASNSPGLWDLEGTIEANIYELALYLKTFPNQINYGMRFDGFRNHNIEARKVSLFGSTDDYTPMTEIDMGYNDDKATSFKLYPDKGELNWADIFIRASFTWLSDPYFKVRSVVKGGSDINVENLSETGTLAFAEATGVDNAGSYLLATINNSTLYVGNNSATVRLNVGQGAPANNTFGLKNFDKTFNLKIKERVHFDSEYITIFGAAASESNTLELQSYQPKIRPSNAETFVGKFPPYVNARYTIAGNLSIVAQQAGIELYVTRTTVTDEAEIAQAVSNGTAFKIANLTNYTYVSPSYLYPISYNGMFPFSIVDDTYYLVILIVNNII